MFHVHVKYCLITIIITKNDSLNTNTHINLQNTLEHQNTRIHQLPIKLV